MFIMLFPLNSFILQGALVTVQDFAHQTVEIQIPSVPSLDFGFSLGSEDPDGGWGGLWGSVWQQVMNPGSSTSNRYAFFGSNFYYNYTSGINTTFDLGYNKDSVYTALVPGAGFAQQCTAPEMKFDLWPTEEEPEKGAYLLWTNISWSADTPNDIHLDAYWKTDTDCIGSYQTARCTLRAATVEYPVEIRMNISDSPYLGPFFSLQRSASIVTEDKVLEILPVDPREGSGTSTNRRFTYAGIRHALAHSYNATYYTISRLGNETFFNDTNTSGQFLNGYVPAQPYGLGSPVKNCNFTFEATNAYVDYYRYLDSGTWNGDVASGLLADLTPDSANAATVIIDRLRQAMFLASIYRGSTAISGSQMTAYLQRHQGDFPREHFIQTVQADRQYAVVRYRMRLWNWVASLAITWVAILLVMPTFWGFWRLPYKKGVSPLEIAQAFRAPLLKGVDDDTRPTEMIKRVGHEIPSQDNTSPISKVDTRFSLVRNDNRDAKVLHGTIYWL